MERHADGNNWSSIIEIIVKHIGYRWKDLFRELSNTDFLETENIIRTIEYRHLKCLKSQAKTALEYLKMSVSRDTLIQALKACGQVYIAEMIIELDLTQY